MKRYKQLFENFIYVQKLEENLRLSDLMKDAGISVLTKKFKKRRTKLIGGESKNAKLLDCEIDETANHVTFVWLTVVTPDIELYGTDYVYGDVNIEGNKKIKRNKSKTYELKIRILKFLDWLDVFEGEEITGKEIKEILDVSDIQVSSNDPSFQYHGFNYHLSSVFDGSIYPTKIPDPVWGPRHNNGDGIVSKHLSSLLSGISFWKNPMASMLTKKLRDRKLI